MREGQPKIQAVQTSKYFSVERAYRIHICSGHFCDATNGDRLEAKEDEVITACVPDDIEPIQVL